VWKSKFAKRIHNLQNEFAKRICEIKTLAHLLKNDDGRKGYADAEHAQHGDHEVVIQPDHFSKDFAEGHQELRRESIFIQLAAYVTCCFKNATI